MAGTVDVDARIAVVLEARKLVERATRWLLVNRRPSFGIAETVSFFSSGVCTVRSAIPKLLSGSDLSGYEERRASFAGSGVPAGLADEVAAMVPSYSAFDIVTSAAATEHGVEETAAVYFLLADRLQLCRLRDLIVALPRDDRWATVGRSALRDDLYAAHAALTRDVLAVGRAGTALTGAYAVAGTAGSAADRVAAWEAANAAAVSRAAATLAEIWESNRFTFTTLSVARPGDQDAGLAWRLIEREEGARPVRGRAIGWPAGGPASGLAARIRRLAGIRVGFPAWQLPIPPMRYRNCRPSSTRLRPWSILRRCARRSPTCVSRRPTPRSGRTRRAPRRSPGGSPSSRAN